MKEAWRLQLTDTDAYLRAVDLEPPPRLDAAPRRALSAQEVCALLDVCRDGSRSGDRDLALLSLMVSTAAWRSEAAHLDLVDLDGDRVVIREAVNQVLARRARAAGIGQWTAHALRRTALTALLEGDLDLASVSQVAGNANTQTTAMYDCRRPRAAGLAAAEAMERLLSS